MSLFEKALIAQGQAFKIPKRLTEAQIETLKEKILSLETFIEEGMPKTPKGEIYCEACGVKSMTYVATVHFCDIYECGLCSKMISQ